MITGWALNKALHFTSLDAPKVRADVGSSETKGSIIND